MAATTINPVLLKPFPAIEELPLLPVREGVLFPRAALPLTVGRPENVSMVLGLGEGQRLGVIGQKEQSQDPPKPSDLCDIGTIAAIHRVLRMSKDHIVIFCEGIVRFRVTGFVATEPNMRARVEILDDTEPQASPELDAVRYDVVNTFKQIVAASPDLPDELQIVAENVPGLSGLADFIGAIMPGLTFTERQGLLSELDVASRLRQLNRYLVRESERVQLRQKIHLEAQGTLSQAQREFMLREQLRAIQKELGEGPEGQKDVADLRERIAKAGLPAEVRAEADKELNRLSALPAISPEYGVARNYLEWMVSLPWSVSTGTPVDVNYAQKVLDEDHYDLEKVKERILDFLAVLQLRPASKGPILCFTGAPGVGKTSLGKSIARALGRKFVRISLGGMHDEAEIRGHRRTYIGALPGQIIHGLRRAGANDPVFMLDEIDKVGSDFRGDPASALLEVLDPEQNVSFRDNFLDVPFDLSKVLFITTANQLDPVAPALRDRMEVIELQGYTEMEKTAIAVRYLVPRQLLENGLTAETEVHFPEETLHAIIQGYTREAGVRNLERAIGSVCRKHARSIAASGVRTMLDVPPEQLERYLGPAKFRAQSELGERTRRPGVAVGLAWTPVGGDVLFVEAGWISGGTKGLIMTGQLGSVMQESVQAALTWVRSQAQSYGIDPQVFPRSDIHVHVPAGAIAKDGPSAGVTIAMALISSLTGRRVNPDFAMTGEITLGGLILPVGGIKEKVLAARRSGIHHVVVPAENEADVKEDLKSEQLSGMTIHYARSVDELAALTLLPAGDAPAHS